MPFILGNNPIYSAFHRNFTDPTNKAIIRRNAKKVDFTDIVNRTFFVYNILICMVRRMSKKWLFCMIAICLLLLSSCVGMVDFQPQEALDAWSSMQSDALLSLLIVTDDTGQVISNQETVDRILQILDGLSVTKITITPGAQRIASNPSFTSVVAQDVEICYQSDTMGEFRFEACANFTRTQDGWQLIWDYTLLLPQMQQDDSVSLTALPASRGEIFTSDRVCVAANEYAPTLYVRPDALENPQQTAETLSGICGISTEEILSAISSDQAARDGVAVIHTYSPAEDLTALRTAISDMRGVGIDESYMSPVRLYPLAENACLLSNLVGYVGAIPADDLDTYLQQGYDEYDTVGLTGLEAAYESTLRGQDGYRLCLMNADQSVRVTLVQKDPVNGADLTLTIDSQMQLAAERALAQQLEDGQSGSLIGLNPQTGAVTVMASYPTYDNNFFTLPVSDEAAYQSQWEALNSDAGNYPLLFRCIQGLYTPGSTAKVFTAAAALEYGVLTPDSVFDGTIIHDVWTPARDDWYYPGIKRISSYSGVMNMTNALIHSDNIYFANATMLLGTENYVAYMTNLGFFEKIPFDLNVYNAQLSSSDDRTLVENIKFLADLGYGQGEMLSTPLQMAVLYSAFANGGNIMKPYVVAHIDQTQNGENVRLYTAEPTVWREDAVSDSVISALVPMMRGVVSGGTASSLDIDGMGIAGKTGTAEAGNNRQHSWFIGFTTEGNDARLACVTLDVATRQGFAVQPLAKVLFTAQPAAQNTDAQTAPQSDTITPGGDEVL